MNRVLTYKGGPILQPSPDQWTSLTRKTIDLLKSRGLRPTTPMSTAVWLARYRGRKLAIYTRALESLRVKQIGVHDFRVKAFIKKEKDKISSDARPDPRIIQPRDPRVTVSLGPYIAAIEGILYKRFSFAWRSIAKSTATPVVMKGYNYVERGGFFEEKWASFNKPVAVAMDASRFDLHVSVDALRFTDSLYETCFHDRYLEKLRTMLMWRHQTVGVARCKESDWAYEKVGGRCSGDVDTSCGNVCIMMAITLELGRLMNCHLELANDGDDQIIMVEESDLVRLTSMISPLFAKYGFIMKVEQPTRVFERIDFCQTRPVRASNRTIMTRYPTLAVTKDACTFLPIESYKEWANMLTAIGKCGVSAYYDMPVLGVFYAKLAACGGSAERHWARSGTDLGFLYHVKGLEAPLEPQLAVVKPATRVSFYKAFNMPPDIQVAIERDITRWTPSHGTPLLVNQLFAPYRADLDHNTPSDLEPCS